MFTITIFYRSLFQEEVYSKKKIDDSQVRITITLGNELPPSSFVILYLTFHEELSILSHSALIQACDWFYMEAALTIF